MSVHCATGTKQYLISTKKQFEHLGFVRLSCELRHLSSKIAQQVAQNIVQVNKQITDMNIAVCQLTYAYDVKNL